MSTKLDVKNLTISFKTHEGKVQAVRGINFQLEQGETLAIVGESGSGKSVTSKAILGILAGNAIVEGGEILYDGKDLLRISEDDFHRIRGDKIAMVFQDPLSSLNPICRIGRQLTEAMLLKGKARQRESRNAFNTYLRTLSRIMEETLPGQGCPDKCKNFDRFEYKHLEYQSRYNRAHEAAVEAVADIDLLTFELEKNAVRDVHYRLGRIYALSLASIEEYMVNDRAEELRALVADTKKIAAEAKVSKEYAPLIDHLRKMAAVMREAIDFPMPNFFALGYYVSFSEEPIPDLPVDDLNKYMRRYLDDHFMLDFIKNTEAALKASSDATAAHIREALTKLEAARKMFSGETLDRTVCRDTVALLDRAMKLTIDPLAITKDSMLYTFSIGLRSSVEKYFNGQTANEREQKRYDRQSARHAAIIAKGKTPGWTVVEPSLVDFDEVKETILYQIDSITAHLKEILERLPDRDYNTDAVAVIDYLKACASGVVQKVTKRMAKDKAIKLMEEVGISEPRKRYNQYPFEFSGGMRQRIVIAIALAADPDILICDEPTTALDVTIQSQILELINKLKRERNLTVIFITHDLGVVANMADRIAVMYAGKIVEYGTSEDVFYHAAHPYTWALLSSMPDLDTDEKLDAIPGTPPNMIYPPKGDAFAERNKYALEIDFEQEPPLFKISDTHYAATWLLHPEAPHVDPPKCIQDRIARMKKKREEQQDG